MVPCTMVPWCNGTVAKGTGPKGPFNKHMLMCLFRIKYMTPARDPKQLFLEALWGLIGDGQNIFAF